MATWITVPDAQVPQLIADAASRYGVPSTLAMSVALRESGLNQRAISSAGAIGVMQLMPATAAQYGANPYSTTQNIDAGMHYLADLLAQFGGDQAKALAAYDAGPARVNNAVNSAAASGSSDWLSLLPSETQNYVPGILGSSGASPAVSIPPPSAPSNGSNSALYLGLAALGAFLLADLLL